MELTPCRTTATSYSHKWWTRLKNQEWSQYHNCCFLSIHLCARLLPLKTLKGLHTCNLSHTVQCGSNTLGQDVIFDAYCCWHTHWITCHLCLFYFLLCYIVLPSSIATQPKSLLCWNPKVLLWKFSPKLFLFAGLHCHDQRYHDPFKVSHCLRFYTKVFWLLKKVPQAVEAGCFQKCAWCLQ